jgi:hypothetical protein
MSKLGAVVDKLFALREERRKLEAKAETIKEKERSIEDKLIEEISSEDATGVVGKLAKAVVNVKTVATVENWDALYKHILKTKDFSFLNKSVGQAAVKERWEDDKVVPGCVPFHKKTISLTKRS